jgi:hypothetical protein
MSTKNVSLGILGGLGLMTSGTYLYSKISAHAHPSQYIINGIATLIDFAYLLWVVYFYDKTTLFNASDLQFLYTIAFSLVLVACALFFLLSALHQTRGKDIMRIICRIFMGVVLGLLAFTRSQDYTPYIPLAVIASFLLFLELD